MTSTADPGPTPETADGTVWVLPDDSAPLAHVVRAFRHRHAPADVRHWQTGVGGARTYGRALTLPQVGRGYPMSVKIVSPALAVELARHPAPVVVVLEIDLVAVYAVLTKIWRRGRRVVALVEGDVAMLGPTGSAGWKMAFRRFVGRFIDGFAANNEHAVRYLHGTLGVPRDRISQGWWLAGLPDGVHPIAPDAAVLAGRRGPTFISVGQLIPRKGHSALIDAAARYRDLHGPCQVWILGEGPDRAALEARAADRLIADDVHFFGQVGASELRGALEAADLFVFPTYNDLVGRALVEAMSTGTPAVVSRHSGAIGTLLHDGENCVVVDPDDPDDLLRGLSVAADTSALARLREGAERTATTVSVDAAAAVIADAVAVSTRS
jgi:glycosyltransferase involved in cell wall biosynthesis